MIQDTREELPGDRLDYERIDKLGIINKEIEPDKSISGTTINRNIQLGNLSGRDYKDIRLLQDMQINFESVPYNQGGFLTHDLAGDLLAKKIDTTVLVSNSRSGFLRKNMRSLTRNQTLNTTASKKSPFGSQGDE